MSNARPEPPKSDTSKPGRKIRFTVPRPKGRGVVLVEGDWLYEGADVEFLRRLFSLGGELWGDGKLWWDGNEFQSGPRPAPVPPPPLSKLDAALHAFNASRNTQKLELLMRSIGSAIGQVREYTSSISDADGLAVVQSDTVEDLLGSALLLCQAHMNAVLQSIEALKPLVRRRKAARNTFLAEGHRARELLKRPSPRMLRSYSLFQVLWALADYYKQRDDWPATWAQAKGDAKRTISIIGAAGITQHTAHKLQTGVRMIGVSQYANLDLLGVICDHWGSLLAEDIRDALGK